MFNPHIGLKNVPCSEALSQCSLPGTFLFRADFTQNKKRRCYAENSV